MKVVDKKVGGHDRNGNHIKVRNKGNIKITRVADVIRKAREKDKKRKDVNPRTKKSKNWEDGYYLRCYLLAKNGLSDLQISKSLSVHWNNFCHWKKVRPALVEALRLGRDTDENGKASDTFSHYVYQRLDENLKETWDRLVELDADSTVEEIEHALKNQGREGKQQLFSYALVHYTFDTSRALSCVGLNKHDLDKWVMYDPDFAELFHEIQWHKKNYLEGAFYKLIAAGDTAAIIYANKTINKDRGFGDKMEIEVKGEVKHNHVIDITKLDLPVEVLIVVHEAIKRQQEKQKTLDVKMLPAGNGRNGDPLESKEYLDAMASVIRQNKEKST